MACQSVLIVAGRIDRDSNQEKLSKLLYDGLLAAFGEDLDKLDAQFLNCLTKPVNAIDSKECELYVYLYCAFQSSKYYLIEINYNTLNIVYNRQVGGSMFG
uniref:Uncharacterized protein n=1 Tax=Schistosoma haematobium TaxID=6185 RepID=A0A094ZL46_SCHHA